MRRLILTIAIGDYHTKMGQITHPFMQDYAKRIGAEFYVIDSARTTGTPHWEKFRIYDLLEVYDRIMYVDTDTLIKTDCPDLFEIVPDNMIGAYNEGEDFQRKYEAYFNAGVMVVSKCHRDVFEKPPHTTGDINTFFEQNVLNGLFHASGCQMYHLPYQFNRMDYMDADGYIIHKAGNLNALAELKELARVLA